jgi:hypothetical protein
MRYLKLLALIVSGSALKWVECPSFQISEMKLGCGRHFHFPPFDVNNTRNYYCSLDREIRNTCNYDVDVRVGREK